MSSAGHHSMMGGKKGWVNPYITDGLVAMWDGEWNAGPGVHDASATVWRDLSGNGYDLTSVGAAVGAKYFNTSSGTFLYGHHSLQIVSIECVCREYSTGTYSMCICVNNANQSIARQNRLMLASIRAGYCERGYQCATDEASALSFVNVGTANLFGAKDGVVTTLQSGNTDWNGNFAISIGGRVRSGATTADFTSNGDYYCVRLYSRALSAAEIAANYAIDKARFGLP